jgi:hypothetical protein
MIRTAESGENKFARHGTANRPNRYTHRGIVGFGYRGCTSSGCTESQIT